MIKREVQTRLVVTENNFTAAFLKIRYMGIRNSFDRETINYTKRTIIQASDLKTVSKSKKLVKKSVIIISLGIESMYPVLTFKMV